MSTRQKEVLLGIIVILIGAWLVYYTTFRKEKIPVKPPLTAEDHQQILINLRAQDEGKPQMTREESLKILENLNKQNNQN